MTGLAVRPLGAGIAAEITGLDLARPVAPEDAAAIRDAFLVHPLLVFPGQRLTRERFTDFAGLFGPIEGHALRRQDGLAVGGVHILSNVEPDGTLKINPLLSTTFSWHSDKSFLHEPALATVLHALELPPEGGDTQFADMARAYDALTEIMKRRLEGLRAVQSLDYLRRSTGNAAPSPEEQVAAPPVDHPLVRTHPETGAKCLYIGMYCSHVLGIPEKEGRDLLDELGVHATAPRFVHTHRWRAGDAIVWDNRRLLHRAVANYAVERHRRVLLRAVVKGDAPY